jgi:hypothetical protein
MAELGLAPSTEVVPIRVKHPDPRSWALVRQAESLVRLQFGLTGPIHV